MRWTDSKGLDTCHEPTPIPKCRGEAWGQAISGPSSLALGNDHRSRDSAPAAKASGLVRRRGCITREGARLSLLEARRARNRGSRQGKLRDPGKLKDTSRGFVSRRPGKAALDCKTEREEGEGCGMESRSRF